MDPATLSAAHTLHLQARIRMHRRPSTIRGYQLYVGGFVRYLEDRGASPGIESLNVDLVGEYQDFLRSRSMGTRDGAAAELMAVRLLKIFARWLWRRGFLEKDPLRRLEEPHLPKLHREPFTQEEVRRLVEAARHGPSPVFERALVLLGLDTGARIGELCGADVEDLDLARGSVLFRHTKNGRSRRVFFGALSSPDGGPCIVAIRQWLAIRVAVQNEHGLFTSPDGERLSTDRARRIYRALGKSAAVPNCVPHRGRHTHASELLGELPGAEIHLRHRLGHVSPDVLVDYITISERAARQVADVASLSAKWQL